MSQIGTSWRLASWATPDWAANAWFGPQALPVGPPVVANTVARLGNLFMKTSYGVGLQEPSVAVRKFLDELKVDRKKILTEERRKLASLKAEKRKTDPLSSNGRTADFGSANAGSSPVGGIPSLDIQIQRQSQVVRDARHLYEEAQHATEQSRIDQLAEYALQEWNREEAIRKAEAEKRQAEEDDEMMHVLFAVHEL